MFRWALINDQTLFDMTIKCYRDPFASDNFYTAPENHMELDWYAYNHMQSELFMYRIMDTNWDIYIENRGDLNTIKNVQIPIRQNSLVSVL